MGTILRSRKHSHQTVRIARTQNVDMVVELGKGVVAALFRAASAPWCMASTPLFLFVSSRRSCDVKGHRLRAQKAQPPRSLESGY